MKRLFSSNGSARGSSAVRAAAWTAGIVALLLAVLLAALTWGPNLARDRIGRYVGEVLGRETTLGRIDVSPFAGKVVVERLAIASSRLGVAMVAIERATVDVDPWAYLGGRVVVEGVTLDAPALDVQRIAPDRFDFSDVIDRFSNRPPSQHKVTWRVDRIDVARGSVRFDDRVVGKKTEIGALRVDARGLTNEDVHVERPATIDTAFTVDGRPASMQVRATPFSPAPVYGGAAKLDALPVSALLPYLPLPDDVRLVAGAIGIDLGGIYRPRAAAPQTVEVQGRARLDGALVNDAAGRERVAADTIAIELAQSYPLGGAVHVKSVALQAPRADLERGADGTLAWPAASARRTPAVATGTPASSTQAAASPSAGAVVGPRSLRIDSVAVDGARIAWRDASLPAPLALRVEPLKLVLADIEIADLAEPAAMRGTGRLDAAIDTDATLAADLALDGAGGTAKIELAGVDVARYAPLAGPSLRATVERGRLAARATLGWRNDGSGWTVADGGAELTGLGVAKDGRTPATIDTLSISGIAVDGAARRVDIAAAKLAGVALRASRDRVGRIDLQDWYVPSSAPATGPAAGTATGTATGDTAAATAAPPTSPSPPWSVRVAQAEVAAFDLDYSDALIAAANKLPRLTLNAKASNLTLDGAQPVPFEASIALADGSRLASTGTVRPTPLDVDATLRVQRLTVTHFDPYLAPYVNLALASGQLWSSGRLRVSSGADGALARIGFDGEVSANEFRAIDKVSSDDFLRWTALAMPSVKVDWRVGRPADSLVEIGAVAFVDFYARIILSPEGRVNLSEVLVDPDRRDAPRSLTAAPSADGPAARRAARAATSAATPGADPDERERQVTYGAAGGAAGAPDARRTASLARGADAGPTIRVGTVRIASGNVNFTDLFIRPNYTANLTQLVGSIGALASDRAEPSDVLVTGRVDADTPLEITGKINPLAATRFIDLRAVARGFDLPKLSPYSGRWAGYAIEKGKLTADVRYRIDGDTLTAENRLTINQLTFGDKVDSKDATSLPVRLAVSLLKDRNGNIDLDLPISGTLSDPQFSVGGLLWRAIGNLIVRVASSPFALLAKIGGADDAGELSHIEFAAGGATLDDEDRKRLDALARALKQRPELSIEIAGVGDPGADREAMRRDRLERTLKGVKLAQMRRDAPTAELPPIADLKLDVAERPALLERAWRDAKLDAGGAGKIPAPDELERLLLDRAGIDTEDVKQVAQQRAQAARDYLRQTGEIADERLYLLAPKIAEPGDTLPPRRADFEVR